MYLLGALRAPVRPRLPTPLRWRLAAVVIVGVVAAMVALDPAKRVDRFKVPPDEDYRTDSHEARALHRVPPVQRRRLGPLAVLGIGAVDGVQPPPGGR